CNNYSCKVELASKPNVAPSDVKKEKLEQEITSFINKNTGRSNFPPLGVKRNSDGILQWLGVKSLEELDVKMKEKGCNSFEEYVFSIIDKNSFDKLFPSSVPIISPEIRPAIKERTDLALYNFDEELNPTVSVLRKNQTVATEIAADCEAYGFNVDSWRDVASRTEKEEKNYEQIDRNVKEGRKKLTIDGSKEEIIEGMNDTKKADIGLTAFKSNVNDLILNPWDRKTVEGGVEEQREKINQNASTAVEIVEARPDLKSDTRIALLLGDMVRIAASGSSVDNVAMGKEAKSDSLSGINFDLASSSMKQLLLTRQKMMEMIRKAFGGEEVDDKKAAEKSEERKIAEKKLEDKLAEAKLQEKNVMQKMQALIRLIALSLVLDPEEFQRKVSSVLVDLQKSLKQLGDISKDLGKLAAMVDDNGDSVLPQGLQDKISEVSSQLKELSNSCEVALKIGKRLVEEA
ncbi:MAG: hypothetical protein NT030_04675, partial [Candidatus Saganbacteria bacterium]|nr:hypothetical protein [Candidatus Saganbacteria bacterium]